MFQQFYERLQLEIDNDEVASKSILNFLMFNVDQILSSSILIQVSFHLQVKGEVSVVQAFTSLIKIEGVKALSKGMFPNVLTRVPPNTLSMLVYETVKKYCLTAEAKSLWLN